MDLIDAVVYINLDKRTDRRTEIEAVLDSLNIPAEKRHRFPAIYNGSGWVGCTQSHHAVIQMAKERGWNRVWVLEDDWMPTVSPADLEVHFQQILGSSGPPFDVLMVASYVQASEAVPGWDQVRRGLNIQTASSYIVAAHYYDTLLKNLGEAVSGAFRGGNHWDFINDQYWKRLQPQGQWLYFSPALGKQRPGHSDLAGRYQDYGV
jgi:hypothetical protein